MSIREVVYEQVVWVFRIVHLVITVAIILALIAIYSYQDITVDQLELNVIIEELLYSPDMFAYQDDITKRSYAGIIDLEKFKNIDLTESINTKR